MLEDKLGIYMAIHECNMYVQDGAPCHSLNLGSDFFKKKNITKLDWPNNNPDLIQAVQQSGVVKG